jgi:hypothetical protein
MCEPVSIGLGLLALAGGVSSGLANRDAAEQNAQALRNNAELARRAASDALQRGEADVGKLVMQGEALEGQQRAAYGASGVVVDAGSAGRTIEDTATITAMDVATLRNNAQREAWGLRTGAANMLRDARTQDNAADNALLGGILGGLTGAATSLIGGSGKKGHGGH